MVRFFLFVILGVVIGCHSSIKARVNDGQPMSGQTLFALDDRPKKPSPKPISASVGSPQIAPRTRTREIIPPQFLARKKRATKPSPAVNPSMGKPKKAPTQKEKEKKNAEFDSQLQALVNKKNQPPTILRPLTKKTIVIDARRLTGHKLTETIRYIKDNPNIRLKLQNATINPEYIVQIMQSFQDAKVIDQIRDISFVMLPGDKNQVLSEQDFVNKVVPYLSHIEGIELSCLGVSDSLVNILSKKIPHLKNICLFGINITDDSLLNLAKTLPNLTKIHLVNTSVTPKGIQLLVNNFPYLQSLGISGHHLTDSDLLALKEGIKNLYSFSMVGQTFKDMNTIKTLLMAMPQLRTLDLSESNVTDQAAKYIAEVSKKLRRLDISETEITASGVREIVQNLDLDKLKINRIRGIGPADLKFIIDKQKGLKTFHFSGATFTNAILMKLVLDLPKLTNLTLIPGDSSWILTEGVAQAIILKKVRLQYLYIQASRLPEILRLEFEKEVPTLRIEYAPDGPVPLNISQKRPI